MNELGYYGFVVIFVITFTIVLLWITSTIIGLILIFSNRKLVNTEDDTVFLIRLFSLFYQLGYWLTYFNII